MNYFLQRLSDDITNQVNEELSVKDSAVEEANEKSGADLAVPCFRYAKDLGKSPQDIASELASKLKLEGVKIEAVSGFVNFTVSAKALAKGLIEDLSLIDAKNYGSNSQREGKKAVLEFTATNPFKELHIGHAYSNIVGESFAKLLAATGAEVHKVSYHGDVGLHIAKAVWGIKKLLADGGKTLDDIDQSDRVAFLGQAYALGSSNYGSNKDEIKELNKAIYDLDDDELKELYETGRAWSFDYFESVYRRLGTSFEKQYFESEVGKVGQKVVQDHITDGVFKESDGAVVYKGEDDGLHTRVFINGQGLPTYEAKEIGLAYAKEDDYHPDISVALTGNEIDSYFKVVLAALTGIDPDLAAKIIHRSHGMVGLSRGKMSSRTGDVISANNLIDEVETKVKGTNPDTAALNENSLGAIKYAFLKARVGGDIVFDVDESISLEGASGPYVQYAAVRVGSILEKAGSSAPLSDSEYNFAAERELLLKLARYPLVVEEAASELEPHKVTTFAYELARELNKYYEQVRVLDSEGSEKESRLALLVQIRSTFEHCLGLLGINIPAKM